MKKLDGEYFIGAAEAKVDVRLINVVDISEIHIVLVSSFQDLMGLPYITSNSEF